MATNDVNPGRDPRHVTTHDKIGRTAARALRGSFTNTLGRIAWSTVMSMFLALFSPLPSIATHRYVAA
jgi:hypothetical protein